MPTYEVTKQFLRDYKKLNKSYVEDWKEARKRFVKSLKSKRMDPRLRVKRVQGAPGIWEMSFAGDGRVTFQYGEEIKKGETHVVLRRIGKHKVLDTP